jgi:ethylmalonyl-CoA mutase
VGLSILSGSHMALVTRIMSGLRDAGVNAKVVVGGIVPDDDATALKADGVAAVYTPKDYSMATIMADLLDLIESSS